MPEDNMSKVMGTDPIAAANTLLATLPGRRTRGRAHILAALIAARRALTHTEIEAVLPPDVVLDRVTLYRILEWLNEHNMVHRVAGADRAVRFAFTGDNDSAASGAEMHAHFQCDTCGRVVCLDTVHTQLPKLENGFSARKADVLVHGQCDLCGTSKPKVVRDSVAD